MNWIGTSWRALLAALVGCALGFVAYGVLAARSIEAPWAVGVAAGGAAAVVSVDRSVMRGLVVGTMAIWSAAAAQVHVHPPMHGASLLQGLAAFHATLTWGRGLSFLVCALAAVVLGAASIRRSARERVAGT